MAGVDYYKVLGVSEDATQQEIQLAFRDKSKTLHPDKNNGDDTGFKSVSEAYATLSVPERRQAYDDSRRPRSFSSIFDFFGGGNRRKDPAADVRDAFREAEDAANADLNQEFKDLFDANETPSESEPPPSPPAQELSDIKTSNDLRAFAEKIEDYSGPQADRAGTIAQAIELKTDLLDEVSAPAVLKALNKADQSRNGAKALRGVIAAHGAGIISDSSFKDIDARFLKDEVLVTCASYISSSLLKEYAEKIEDYSGPQADRAGIIAQAIELKTDLLDEVAAPAVLKALNKADQSRNGAKALRGVIAAHGAGIISDSSFKDIDARFLKDEVLVTCASYISSSLLKEYAEKIEDYSGPQADRAGTIAQAIELKTDLLDEVSAPAVLKALNKADQSRNGAKALSGVLYNYYNSESRPAVHVPVCKMG